MFRIIIFTTKMVLTKEKLQSYIPQSWKQVLQSELNKEYWNTIVETLNECDEFFPPLPEIFNALNGVTPENVKVVLLGQDPYPTKDVAHGYSFSVKKGKDIPPSLQNIFKELSLEYKIEFSPQHGNLEKWEEDGVLLLNTILTVEERSPLSHKGIGWEQFTDAILKYLFSKNKNVMFLCLGGKARETVTKLKIDFKNIIFTSHPSPLNTRGGFIGSNCFINVNKELMSRNELPIRWILLNDK